MQTIKKNCHVERLENKDTEPNEVNKVSILKKSRFFGEKIEKDQKEIRK